VRAAASSRAWTSSRVLCAAAMAVIRASYSHCVVAVLAGAIVVASSSSLLVVVGCSLMERLEVLPGVVGKMVVVGGDEL
jgi:hypothetical protein